MRSKWQLGERPISLVGGHTRPIESDILYRSITKEKSCQVHVELVRFSEARSPLAHVA